jgi:DNA helicase II / ATP-dependent DNA helicase PcrA
VIKADGSTICNARRSALPDATGLSERRSSVSPAAAIIALERNYRSTQTILDAANAIIAGAGERFAKTLYSTKQSAELPYLVTAEDEAAQASYVADYVPEYREAGIALKRQAVLFRAAHHSDLLEVELGRRNIPFVKYSGLKFLETAHVKDVLAILRWAETRVMRSPDSARFNCIPGSAQQPRATSSNASRTRALPQRRSHGSRRLPRHSCNGRGSAA